MTSFYSVFTDIQNQFSDIISKEAYGYSHKNNTEELTHDIYSPLSYPALHLIGHAQHKEHKTHINKQTEKDVDIGILGTQRE